MSCLEAAKPPPRRPDYESEKKAYELRAATVDVKTIAKTLNAPERTVRFWIANYRRRNGIKPEPRFTGKIHQLDHRFK